MLHQTQVNCIVRLKSDAKFSFSPELNSVNWLLLANNSDELFQSSVAIFMNSSQQTLMFDLALGWDEQIMKCNICWLLDQFAESVQSHGCSSSCEDSGGGGSDNYLLWQCLGHTTHIEDMMTRVSMDRVPGHQHTESQGSDDSRSVILATQHCVPHCDQHWHRLPHSPQLMISWCRGLDQWRCDISDRDKTTVKMSDHRRASILDIIRGRSSKESKKEAAGAAGLERWVPGTVFNNRK